MIVPHEMTQFPSTLTWDDGVDGDNDDDNSNSNDENDAAGYNGKNSRSGYTYPNIHTRRYILHTTYLLPTYHTRTLPAYIRTVYTYSYT